MLNNNIVDCKKPNETHFVVGFIGFLSGFYSPGLFWVGGGFATMVSKELFDREQLIVLTVFLSFAKKDLYLQGI